MSAFSRWLGELLSGGDGDLQQSQSRGFFGTLLQLLWLPLYLLFQFLAFLFTTWAISRSGRAFLLGLPALLVALGCFATVVFINAFYQNIVYNRYSGIVIRYITDNQPEEAVLLSTRLVREKPEDRDFRFRYAIARELRAENNDQEVTWDIMDDLAPNPDRLTAGPVYPAAHRWKARQYLGQSSETPARVQALSEDERLNLALKHYWVVAQADEAALDARNEIAQIYDSQSRPEDAIRNFKYAIDYQYPPDTDVSRQAQIAKLSGTPRLAELLIEQGETTEANLYVDRTVRILKLITDRFPSEFRAWLLMVQSELARKNYAAGQTILDLAARRSGSQAVRRNLQVLLSEFYLRAASEIEEYDSQDSFEDKVNLLNRSMSLFLQRPETIDAVIEVCLSENSPESTDEWLIEAIFEQRISPGMGHLVRGCREALAGDLSAAISHFRVADAFDRATIAYLNAFLMRLTTSTHERAGDALQISQATQEIWPDVAAFNVSRGVALLESGRHEEAVAELEIAAERLQDSEVVLGFLADAYEADGQSELALETRERIEEIRKDRELEAARRGESESL